MGPLVAKVPAPTPSIPQSAPAANIGSLDSPILQLDTTKGSGLSPYAPQILGTDVPDSDKITGSHNLWAPISRILSNHKLLSGGVSALFSVTAIIFLVSLLFHGGNTGKSQVNQQNIATDSLISQQATIQLNRDTVIAPTKSLTAFGFVRFQSVNNSPTAFEIQSASGSPLLVADTSNMRVGIGINPTGNAALQVSGDISATGTLFAGGGVSSLSATALRIDNVVVCTAAGCLGGSGDGGGGGAQNNQPTCANGKCLSLQSSSPGTPEVGNINITGVVTGGTFVGDGSGLTNVALLNGQNTFRPTTDSTTVFQIQNAAGTSSLLVVDTTNTKVGIGLAPSAGGATLQVAGNVDVTGQFTINGAQISSANLSNDANLAKLDGIQIFTGANTFSNVSNSFTGSGAGLISLNANNISSGTLSDFRLSANVALLDGTGPQTFTGNNKFTGTLLSQNATDSISAFQVQNAAGTSNLLVADTTNTRIGIGTATPTATLSVTGTGLIQASTANNPTLTVSGNEITDTIRTTGTSGDGRAAPDSSYGIWEGTTNLLTYSNTLSNAAWITGSGSSQVTAASTADGPGTDGGWILTTIGTNHFFRQTATVSASTTYTFSFWAKRGTMTDAKYSIYDLTHSADIVGATKLNLRASLEAFLVGMYL